MFTSEKPGNLNDTLNDQHGEDEGRSQGENRIELEEPGGTQFPARIAVDGGRSHGGGMADNSR